MIRGNIGFVLSLFMATVFVFAGCEQEYSIQTAAVTEPDDSDGNNDGGGDSDGNDVGNNTCSGTFTEAFQFTPGSSVQTKSNVFIVVDTSSSMTAESAKLSQNLLNFTQGITAQLSSANTRFVLMGKSGSTVPLNLSPAFAPNQLKNNVYWHEWFVGSRDKFHNVAGAYGMQTFKISPTSSTYGLSSTYSQRAIPSADITASSSCDSTYLFSCNAMNHLIFVTDDTEIFANNDSQDASVAVAFEYAFGGHLTKTGSVFRGHAIYFKSSSVVTSSCNRGRSDSYRVYDKLIADTGGMGLDLCQDDWSPLLSALQNNIIQSAASFYPKSCPGVNKQILSVKLIQGSLSVFLAAGDYTFSQMASGASLSIAPSVLQSKGFNLSAGAGQISVTVSLKTL